MNFSLKGLYVKLASLNFSHASLRKKKPEIGMSPQNKGKVEGWEGGWIERRQTREGERMGRKTRVSENIFPRRKENPVGLSWGCKPSSASVRSRSLGVTRQLLTSTWNEK